MRAGVRLVPRSMPSDSARVFATSITFRTGDLYSHAVPSLQREAAREMGVALFG